jgi:hypothetical protein
MSHFKPDDFYQGFGAVLEKALHDQRYHEVLLGSLSAYLFFREREEKSLEKDMLLYVRRAIDALSPDHECSFCGRREPDVRLAAGAKGFICDDCVGLLGELFHPKSDS